MMNGYYIVEQKDGKGVDAEMVLIKAVKKGPSTDSAGKVSGFFPLLSGFYIGGKRATLPCLKVVVGNGDEDYHLEVRWSNYYGQKGLNPGKWKLVFVKDKQPNIIYQHDHGNNRKMIDQRTGKPMIDFMEMAIRFGSEPIMSGGKYPKMIGWNFGEKQTYTREAEDMWECETFDGTQSRLVERFGKKLATDILLLFVEHEVFNEWIDESVESVAA